MKQLPSPGVDWTSMRSSMFVHDAVADRETEAGALADRFGREEGVKDSLADFRLDAASGVGDFDSNALALAVGSACESSRCLQTGRRRWRS